jgi:hypothetical protein
MRVINQRTCPLMLYSGQEGPPSSLTVSQVRVLSHHKAKTNDLDDHLNGEDGYEEVVGRRKLFSERALTKPGLVGLHGKSDAVAKDDHQHQPLEHLPSSKPNAGLSNRIVDGEEKQGVGS